MSDAAPDAPPAPPETPPPTSGRVRRARLVGFALGALLLAAAVGAVLSRSGELQQAWSAIRAAPLHLLALGVALPFLTVAVTSQAFWVLTARYGPVRPGEMLALINTAWLLNYLPMWPGMFGRLAYHKSVNGIAVRDSAKAIVWANVLNIGAAAATLGSLVLGSLFFDGSSRWLIVIAAAPIPLAGLVALHAWRVRPEPDPELWRLFAAVAVRALEIHIHGARYLVCFALTGSPIDWGGSLALAGIAALAGAINIAPNGLGVREWVIGLVAPLLPVALVGSATLDLTSGLAADLVNRALEVLVAVPTGLIASAWVARRLRRHHAASVPS